MAMRSKLLTAAVQARVAEKVSEARRRGVPDEALAWFERGVRIYELGALDHGVALVATASALSTAEAVLASGIEAQDALRRRNRELEDRIRVLEARPASGRQRVVVPFARRPRLRRVGTVVQARR